MSTQQTIHSNKLLVEKGTFTFCNIKTHSQAGIGSLSLQYIITKVKEKQKYCDISKGKNIDFACIKQWVPSAVIVLKSM